jgi:hypothetical protein
MDIIYINNVGVIEFMKVQCKNVSEFSDNYKTYTNGKYTYCAIKNDKEESIPIKLKCLDTFISSNVFLIKTNKNNKIVNIKIDDIINLKYMTTQVTSYDSDNSSDIEYDPCDHNKYEIC